MWLICAVIGLFLGAISSHDNLWLFGAILGGIAGHLLQQRHQLAKLTDALTRIKLLESEVALLRYELDTQAQAVATAHPLTPPTASPQEQVGEASAEARPAQTASDACLHQRAEDPLSAADKPLEQIPQAWQETRRAGTPAEQDNNDSSLLPDWLQGFWQGNPLVKVGIVLLFFGVASGLKLAVQHAVLPIWLRLILAACAGLGLLSFGYSRARQAKQRIFGLSLQGGGCALLYLVVYFMFARYTMIGQLPAFSLFALLGVSCVLLAVRQDGAVLAVFGVSGAFLAPVLAGGRSPTPLPLFLYLSLLNAFILIIDWSRAWRVLNIAGFILSLAVAGTWAVDNYRDSHYLLTQCFIALFLFAYSAMPALTALWRSSGRLGWQEGTLLFGPALAGAFLQHQLLGHTLYGEAWSAFLGALWYLLLWQALFRRPEAEIRLLERSHLAIAIALLTLAIPLAFGAQATSAFWAAEGCAVVWFGGQQKRRSAQFAGIGMIFLAGIALLPHWATLGQQHPFFNDQIFGAAIITASSLFAARQLRALGNAAALPAFLPFIWGILWWLGCGLQQIEHFLPANEHAAAGLLLISASLLLLEGLIVLWRWPEAQACAILLPFALWASLFVNAQHTPHPLANLMLLAAPVALLIHERLLARHLGSSADWFWVLRSLSGWWYLLTLCGMELAWLGEQYMASPELWRTLAWLAILSLGVALPTFGERLMPALARLSGAYTPNLTIPPLLLGLAGLLCWANLNLAGNSPGIPYLPVFSFFDLGCLLGFTAIHRYLGSLSESASLLANRTLLGLIFLWISAMAARLVHAWAGIPFTAHALLHATAFHASLSLLWTTLAMGCMIFASRRQLLSLWYAGFALLCAVGGKLLLIDARNHGTLAWTLTLIGVALLVLAAAYFAPRPPGSDAAFAEEPASPSG